jgi:predicted 2-oxoglutarate/Fe(II)-dependent dioxygenase YbiX
MLLINIVMLPNLPNPHNKLTLEEFNSFVRTITIEDAISLDMCDSLITYGQALVEKEQNKHNRSFQKVLDNCWLPLDHEIHAALQPAWKQANDFFKFKVTFVEPYDLKRYQPGGFFNRHIDNYHGNNVHNDRKISMSLQLSDETSYGAGDLIIGNYTASKKKLSATFFPSFYPHYVEKITTGTRWALIGWAWGPYWE